jgi:hypothetical protein
LATIIGASLLAISARHINVIFFVFPVLYFLHEGRSIWKTISRATWIKGLSFGFVFGSLFLGLQLIYNQYAFGSFLATGYAEESFSNWNNIKLIELWFAPNNGVFIFSPVIALSLYSVWKFRNEEKSLWSFAALFFALSIVYAAWWSPTLGCGFGHRGFSEFLVFFSLPLALILKSWPLNQIRLTWVLGVFFMILLFSAQWTFDGCWYGADAWDWSELGRMISI